MRSALDVLLDVAEMARCLQRESEVVYAKDFFVNLFEEAFRRVDRDLQGEASAIRLLIPDKAKLVEALRTHVQLRVG